ncbi:hypothetical protein ACHWQZ_G009969 [Mnemiopsis leidyi]
MSGYNVSIPESEPPLYQLQDNGYTVIWAPILFATVIALSLVGILVPLWEFLFQRKPLRRHVSVVSLFDDGAELEHVSEINPEIKMELARMLDEPSRGGKGWRELANELGYQYEIKGRAGSDNPYLVSPTVSLLNRWQFTNTATVENLLKSLYSIERSDCACLLEAKYNVILIECLTTV